MTIDRQPKPHIDPDVEALSGKSYEPQNQTAGALGGRRAVQRWFYETVPPVGC